MAHPIISPAAVVFVVFVVLLYLFVQFTIRRQLRALSKLACPSCGTYYGMTAAKRARQDHLERIQEARKQIDFWDKPNFSRCWAVRCPQCGVEATFLSEKKRLVEHDD